MAFVSPFCVHIYQQHSLRVIASGAKGWWFESRQAHLSVPKPHQSSVCIGVTHSSATPPAPGGQLCRLVVGLPVIQGFITLLGAQRGMPEVLLQQFNLFDESFLDARKASFYYYLDSPDAGKGPAVHQRSLPQAPLTAGIGKTGVYSHGPRKDAPAAFAFPRALLASQSIEHGESRPNDR